MVAAGAGRGPTVPGGDPGDLRTGSGGEGGAAGDEAADGAHGAVGGDYSPRIPLQDGTRAARRESLACDSAE